ncbi:MAG: iron-containing alcohol dehydrogenase, partial [Francisellaceae bacterium]
DAAKIMWLMYDNPEIHFDDLTMRFMDIRKRIISIPEATRKTKFIAVPTTSGTGSEISPFSVITDDKTGIKYPIADYSLTPDVAVIDSQFIQHMPKGLTASSGFDAITHAIEAYVSIMASPFSDAQAKEALNLLSQHLLSSYENGAKDRKGRAFVHYASTLAGIAFSNASLGLAHSIAHKLGEHFHIAHGTACALALPYVIQYNATDLPSKLVAFPKYKTPKALERYAEIATLLGLKGRSHHEKVSHLLEYLMDMKRQLSLPASLKEAGVSEAEFMAKVDHIAEEAFDDQCTPTNPRYPLIAEIKEVLMKIYEGSEISVK